MSLANAEIAASQRYRALSARRVLTLGALAVLLFLISYMSSVKATDNIICNC